MVNGNVEMQNISEVHSIAHSPSWTALYRVEIWAAFGILCFVGVLTNIWMIIVLSRMKTTVFTTILVGLCISDVVSSCNSPLFVYLSYSWSSYRLPDIFCYLILPVDLSTSAATICLISLLSFVRFRNVVHAMDSKSYITVKQCQILVTLVYILAFTIVPLPFALNLEIVEVESGRKCDFNTSRMTITLISCTLSLILGILAPMIAAFGFCIAIIIFLIKRRLSGITSMSLSLKVEERQALVQLFVIIVSFLLGYLTDYSSKTFLMFTQDNISVQPLKQRWLYRTLFSDVQNV